MGSVKSSRIRVEHSRTQIVAIARNQEYLSPERELELAARMLEGDAKAADQIVRSHFRMVIKMASAHARQSGADFDDLVSAGNEGLAKATRRFDPRAGTRFATYALWWINAEFKDYFLKNASQLKIPWSKDTKSFFFKGKRIRKQLEMEGKSEAEILDGLAKKFDLPVDRIEQIEAAQRTAISMSAPMSSEFDDKGTFGDVIADDRPLQDQLVEEADEHSSNVRKLNLVLAQLNEREIDIFRSRRLVEEPMTLDALALRHSVSKERIRQIEVKAFEKVKKALLFEAVAA